jgi:hypothetical protein
MYMSLVFRGAVEDYEKTGVHPSVFMDGNKQLQIYLCDPVADERGSEEEISINNCGINGAQFSNAILIHADLQEINSGNHSRLILAD